MLFWTVVFLTANFYWLMLNPMKNGIKNYDNLISEYKNADNKEDITKQLLEAGFMKTFMFMLSLIFWHIAEFIYLMYALKVDPLTYPSVAVLAYHLFGTLLVSTISAARKEKVKKNPILRVLNGVIYSVYFGYIFYVLVF